MAITFAPDALITEKLVARRALTQLNLMSIFARAGIGDYETGSFELGDTVKFRRARISEADEYDPRTGNGLNLTQPGYVTGELKLEKLLTNGFPVYGSDYRIDEYINDFSTQIAFSITTKFDSHLYNKFRTPTHADAGLVAYGAHAPVACVAAEDANGQLVDFNRQVLVAAGTVLERENVPPGMRYALLSSTAKGAYVGESVPVDAGYMEALAGGVQLLQQGLPIGQFVPRHGFMVGGSNIIGSQIGQDDLDANTGSSASLAISAAVADTGNGGSPFFLKADNAVATSLGAIVLTLTTTGALQNVAVGDICRIGPADAIAKAYGVVLRVDLTNKNVYIVPFSPKGLKLLAAQINLTTDKFSIPTIPSISIAMHQESLVYSSREMRPPSEGSGAVATTQVDPAVALAMQIWRGSYDVTRFRESQLATLLMGAKITDYRKCCLILSQ
ncbi:MAG TPA: hypothetical protein V6C57_22710 [Coleofasciculaceae cyanobacterium]